MKLFIKRDQDSGLMGGVSFILNAHVELQGDENELIRKYKVQKETLLIKTISIFGKRIDLTITIGGLIDGQKFKCKDLAEIINYEENIKDACQILKNNIELMKKFGGEDVYEY